MFLSQTFHQTDSENMGKRIKLRITRFLSCKSKDSSTFPIPPIPIFRQPTDLIIPVPTKPRVSKTSVSVSCGCRPKHKAHAIRSSTFYNINGSIPDTPPRRKIYNSPPSDDSDSHVSSSPAFLKKTKKSKSKARFSNCSAETAWFSSEEASSFSSSFSDSNAHLDPINETPISGVILRKKKKRHNKVKKAKVSPLTARKVMYNSPETESPVRRENEDGSIKESLAVMKKSEDPYMDFRKSMMEMIVEKEMFDTKDLEQLLQCFLSLNSKHHYGAIIEAFSDIWEILFSKSTAM